MIRCIACLIGILSMISCQKYHYLTDKELDGIILSSNNHVYQIMVKIQAESKCESTITINLNAIEKYIFQLDTSIDTVFVRDWYNEPLYLKVEYDSCLTDTPKIGVKLSE